MSKRFTRVALAFAAAVAVTAGPGAQSAPSTSGYQLPPKAIVDILDAAPTPTVIVSPNRQTVALLERKSMPGIADLAEPIHRLAGARINPVTNGRQQRTGDAIAITLKTDRRRRGQEGRHAAERQRGGPRVFAGREAPVLHEYQGRTPSNCGSPTRRRGTRAW